MRGRGKRHFALLISLLLLSGNTFMLPAQAEGPAHSSAGAAANTYRSGGGQPVNLDLTSTTPSMPAPHFVETNPVNIQMGGISTAVNRDSLLTPAQRIAAFQVFRTGQQSLELGALGNAVGGSFALGQRASQMLGNLVIPQGVTAVKNFASNNLNLAGNLTNAGTFYAFSSNPAVTTATIAATNIHNLPGGVITSVLPAGGLPGVASAVANLNLNLVAVNNIINQGTISSSGSLAMQAGGSITNQALVSAMQNVNLAAGSGHITNSGTIAAALGNINVSSATGLNLLINNTNGTLQAANGKINAATAGAATEALDLKIVGGDLVARELNLTACPGTVDVKVENLTGRVNVSANEVHVAAATANLVLGDMHIVGDPTFYNTQGSITIAGDLLFNSANNNLANLAIVASGDIVTGQGAGQISTTNTNGNAGSILMVAGANFSESPSDLPDVLPPGPGDTTHTLTITTNLQNPGGGSLGGGQINLGGNDPITSFDTRSLGGNGVGGGVTLIAFAGQNSGSGTINVPVTIQTGTAQNDQFATNGNVQIIAGAASITAITLAGINTTGNTLNPVAANGQISIASATPIISNGGVVVAPGAGQAGNPASIFTGSFTPAATPQQGNISITNINSGGNVSITTGGVVFVAGAIALSQNPTLAYITTPAVSIKASSLTVQSGGSINSAIAGQPNSVNIDAVSVINNGTIAGNVVNITTQSFTMGATANITGNGNNAFVNIQSTSSLGINGNGTILVPAFSVVEFAAADNNALSFSGPTTITTGPGSLVIFDAQQSNGSISFAGGSTTTINGGPVVSINTPNLLISNGAAINATGASEFAISGGFSSNGLTLTVSGGGSATISTGSGGAIRMRPMDGQNITITAPIPATLNLTGGPVTLATAIGSQATISSNVTVNGNVSVTVNPSGGISGVAFQPYVGGPVGNGFTLFGAYSYQQVLVLLAPIVASQQFQLLSTYTQQNSAGFVIQAAKQVGLRVEAGIFVTFDNAGTITSQATTTADIQAALNGAATFGNVASLVVGNENIVGGSAPGPSISALTTLINTVKGQRNTTTNPVGGGNFNAQTLPVTTRQVGGIYSLVNPSSQNSSTATAAAMVQLLQATDGFVYGDFYPFLATNVINAIIANPAMNQSTFTNLVNTEMSAEYNLVANNIKTFAGTQTALRIGETGWATQAPPDQQCPACPAQPQAQLNFAQWYYPAMQLWSATTPNVITGGTGVPIQGYFEAYNEPWKPTTNGVLGEPYFGLFVAGGTTGANGTPFTLTSITQNVPLPLFVAPPPPPPQGTLGGIGTTPPPVATAPPPSVLTFDASASSANNNSTAALNAQLSTKIATDVTQLGTSPTSQPGPLSSYQPSPNATPYSDIGGGGGGWKNSGDGDIWSCTGCLGSLPEGENTQNAIRVMEKLSADISGKSTEWLPDAGDIAQANGLRRLTPSGQLLAQAGGTGSSASYLPSTAGSKDADFFDLRRGVAMFNAKNKVVVGTMEGKVHIDKGSLGFVIETGHDVAIYNLHDRRSGGMKVVVGRTLVNIPPGKQLVLTRQLDADFDKVNPSSKIGYRNPRAMNFSDGIKGFMADFSIPAAIFSIPPLKNMLKSSKASERLVAYQLLKNAAILADLTAAAGPYMSTK